MKKTLLILWLFIIGTCCLNKTLGYCGINSYWNRYCTDGYTYEYRNNQVPWNPYYWLPYYKWYWSNNWWYTYEYYYVINPSAVYLTPDEECDLKYPWTIYRASDKRCACKWDEKWTSSRDKNEHCDKKVIKQDTANQYSTLYRRAYNYSREMWITTMYPIDNARMYSDVTRWEAAKMLSNRVKWYWHTLDTSKNCSFKDINTAQWDLWKYVIEACQFWIMWIWIDEFRPNDNISRWEIATAISRIIWWNKFDWWTPYYMQHINALSNEWILPNTIAYYQNEKRWDLMVMFLNAAQWYRSCNEIEIKVLCSLERYENNYKECPAICRDLPGIADEQTLLEVTWRTSLEDHTILSWENVNNKQNIEVPKECLDIVNKVNCSFERYENNYKHCPVICRDLPGVADEQTLLEVTWRTSLEGHTID